MEKKLNKKIIPPFEEEFKAWCIERHGLSKESVNIYLSNIRTAYDNFCYTYKDLFRVLETSFQPIIQPTENLFQKIIATWDIEYALEYLDAYIKDLVSLNNGILIFNEKTEEWKIAVVQNWVQALRTYMLFLEFKFINFRHEVLGDSCPPYSPSFKFPFKKEFAKYLTGRKYSSTSIWTYISRFNKCMEGIFNKYHFKEFLEELPSLVKSQDNFKKIESEIKVMTDIMETEIELRETMQDSNELHEPWITKQDLQDAINMLDKYKCFIKELIQNPDKFLDI
ncbi:MAG: hypothetical protein J1F16_01145 [Muribaculaceae bacterium]|nr:hypothetical protein [Muribaculaceae bacterium]